MTPLPIDERIPEVLSRVREGRCLVLVAPPGAGKTTRVPAALLESGLLPAGHPAVIVLQPRRVAARATAARIAEERGWTLGEEVGYQVRLDRMMTRRTRLRIQTEGVLTRQILADPFLETVGAVVLDEFHERSLHGDLALAFLREIRREVRPDLILMVMSATLDAAPVSRFLNDCPVVQVEGKAYPVEVSHRPASGPATPAAVVPAVREVLADHAETGHILVFLPGMAEIRRVRHAIEPLAADHDIALHLLHGSLPAEEQDRALRSGGRRKLILATNLAETSLTIDGVTTVIDSGLARMAHHDPQRGVDRLELGRISLASAAQRAGRAGRTGPGRCIRLWAAREERGMSPFETPEVHRVDLCSTVLAIHSWGVRDPNAFTWYEPPAPERLEAATRLLGTLGAIDRAEGRLTPLGRQLIDLPVHPRLGRLLISAAEQGRGREGAALAALISEKDIAVQREAAGGADGRHRGRDRTRTGVANSDLLVRLDWLEEAERMRFAPALRDRGIDASAARNVARVRDDLVRVLNRIPGTTGAKTGEEAALANPEDELLKWLLLAYPDRVVRRRGSADTGVMVGGRGVRVDPSSVVVEGELFLALDAREERRNGPLELQVRLASLVLREWLEELLPELLRRERATCYLPDRERVVGVTRLFYQDLLLSEDANEAMDPVEASTCLAAALAPQALPLFQEDPAASAWLARCGFVMRAVPELDWPAFDAHDLSDILPDLCQGLTRLQEVRQADKVRLLEARLTPVQRQELRQSAPIAIRVPSGREIRLHYEQGRPPVLAVRLQELFGWTETPRLARGRTAVVLELLGPNHRPVQITSDLRSFWTTTYQQVRKDLRGRYPKHHWPEDPFTAQPASGPRKRGT